MKENNLPKVYVIQEIPGTKDGKPKINIMGAREYGDFKFLLPELSQIIFSPGPLIFKLRQALKNFSEKDYLNLEKFVERNKEKTISYSEACKAVSDSLYDKTLRFLSKKILQLKRKII